MTAATDRRADVLAGLSIAGLLLTSSVAYADIAGLPAQAGVVGLLIGMACYGLVGRSRFAIVSPTSSAALVLAAGTAALAAQGGLSATALAATMTVLTGALFLLSAALRLGGLSQLVARPVLRGFSFGLAVVIAIGQLPHLSGLPAVHAHTTPQMLWQLAHSRAPVQAWSLACGVAALVVLIASARLRKVPGGLLVIVLGIALAPWLGAHGVALVGTIDPRPTWAIPAIPAKEQWLPSVELGAALVLVLYAESYASIRGFALRHGDPVEPDRDLLALGVANVCAGLLHGMPVGAGYSATAANEAAGANSRLAAWVALGCSVLMAGALLRFVERIPEPVLAAIVIYAVSASWRLSAFAPYLKWQRDRLLVLAAIIAVLALGVLEGLLVAIALSVVLLLQQLARPRLVVLGRLNGGHDFVPIGRVGAAEAPGVLTLRPEEPLFFANAEAIFALARAQVQRREGLRSVVLSLEESPDLDGTALEALADFAAWLQGRGLLLRAARLKDDTREVLLRAALPQLPTETLDDWSVDDAVKAASA
ncbi:MAG: SulP family inorganic anion transporter [Proteobacteria bacterium]|nr:SulP family inorganic anion transporter [Pseudomonadota bacterium]MBS0463681.1 SulP family inorganic anion transporter [Pseudomonadota bacterium]